MNQGLFLGPVKLWWFKHKRRRIFLEKSGGTTKNWHFRYLTLHNIWHVETPDWAFDSEQTARKISGNYQRQLKFWKHKFKPSNQSIFGMNWTKKSKQAEIQANLHVSKINPIKRSNSLPNRSFPKYMQKEINMN